MNKRNFICAMNRIADFESMSEEKKSVFRRMQDVIVEYRNEPSFSKIVKGVAENMAIRYRQSEKTWSDCCLVWGALEALECAELVHQREECGLLDRNGQPVSLEF